MNETNTNMDRFEFARAEATARSIFRPDRRMDIMVPLLTDRLSARTLGAPFYEQDLTETQWANFVMALRRAGYEDTEAFATVLFSAEGYWKVPLEAERRPYQEIIRHGWPSIFESATYSKDGHWALAVGPGEFAIAAGDVRFIEALGETMPEFTEAAAMDFVRECRAAWAGYPDAFERSMVPELLEHVYGPDADRWIGVFTRDDGQ